MGCVSQVGEQALNVARMSALVAGWPETVCGTSIDRQCGSSMQAAFSASSAIQAGHPRRRRRLGRRVDVARADGIEPHGERLRGLLAEALRALGGRPAGNLRRGHRGRVGPLARAARRVLVRVAHACDRRDRRGPLRARDRPRRGRRGRRGRAGRRRREPAARHVAREARRAEARLQGGREGHRGQLERDRGRCRGDARDERGRGSAARARAAGASSRSGSPGSTRTGCSTATRSRASARSRRPVSAGTTWP